MGERCTTCSQWNERSAHSTTCSIPILTYMRRRRRSTTEASLSRGTCRARRREHRRTATSGGVYEIRLRQYTSTAGTSTASTSTTGTGSQEELWTKSTSIHRGTERPPRYQIYEYRSISTTGIWCNIHDWSSTTTRIAVTSE